MDNTKKALITAKALAYTENGGKPGQPKAGKTGEMKSIFQFTPDTWKHYAKEVTGDENLPLNTENEIQVVTSKCKQWYDEGKNTEQIASMWNAGEHKPDAYKQNWKGTNKKYGVSFDTPGYAKKVVGYTNQFIKENDVPSLDDSQDNSKPFPQVAELTNKLMQLKQVSDARKEQSDASKTIIGTQPVTGGLLPGLAQNNPLQPTPPVSS